MSYSRRQFLISTAISTAGLALSYSRVNPFTLKQEEPDDFKKEEKATRLILLGTRGGPRVSNTGRNNPSTLLMVKGQPYIIDCGYGTSRQLISTGVALNRLRYIFITHHHSDHNLEYGPLIYNAWVTGMPIHIESYGPAGLQKMTSDFFEYLKFDIDTRIADEGRSDIRKQVSAYDHSGTGLVMVNEDVKVTACLVHHPPIKEAYAFRFDTKDRSVVISGDTAYFPELARFAKGADVLVHEVMYLPAIEKLAKRLPDAKRLHDHLLASHTSTEDVGRIAAMAGVKTLVLTHFVPADDSSITDQDWSEGVRRHFNGRIIIGKDLMEIRD